MKAVGTNGLGEPRYLVAEVPPGCIVRFGIDDDMTALVVANFPCLSTGYVNGKRRQVHKLVYYGCLNEAGTWGEGSLFQQEHDLTDTVTVIMMPEYS